MAGVVLISKFTLPNSKKNFSGMINYIDRKEAVENENISFTNFEKIQENRIQIIEEELNKYNIFNKEDFSGIINYMDRCKAKDVNSKYEIGLFTNEKDFLNEGEKKILKDKFDKAQENGSVMWNDVISFDNEWLEEQGIYSKDSKILDKRKLKKATRKSVEEMLRLEKIHNAIWCGDIHFNTDNIHIHIATVEEVVTRERGKRKPKTLEKMKSKIISELTDDKEIYKRINDIIRKDIIDSKKKISLSKEKATKELFLQAYSMLPEDKKHWQYNYNSIKNVRPLLNKITDIYIEENHKKSFDELTKLLIKQEKKSSNNYGGENNYYQNRMDDLYTRMGNAILKEMKEYDIRKKNKINSENNYDSQFQKRLSNDNLAFKKNTTSKIKGRKKLNLNYDIKNLNYHLNSEYENFKNQIAYEQMQNQIEHNY